MTTRKKNRNVLLISPSGWQKESVNLGLACLASPLLHEGFDVQIFDLDYQDMEDAVFLERLRQYDPFVVGISVKTATANEGGRLARLVAESLPDAVIVAGGPHMTLCAKEYLSDEPSYAYGIMGEAELSFLDLVKALHQGTPVTANKGVAWRDGDEIVVNEWAPPQDLTALPFPNMDVIDGFKWEGFRYPIVTSRGCPFKCTYCCVGKLAGSIKWRRRGAAGVVDELESVAKGKGITHFEVWDDNFTLHVDRAKEICQELIDRALNLSWYCHNGIRADKITPELATLMKAAGCTSVAFGMETGNPETFLSIQKGETLQDVVDAVKIVKDAGINAVGYFIIGLPGDTLETFIETIHFQRGLDLDHHVFGVLIPYPQTEVWNIVQERGRLLCDITETQHFSDDIVPISFELPEFPKEDMVRAYYIATYFDFYEVVESVTKKSETINVIYVGADQYLKNVVGLMIACPAHTRHTVVTQQPLADMKAHEGLAQIKNELDISAATTVPEASATKSDVYVCMGAVPSNLAAKNANIVLIDPARPLRMTEVARRYIPNRGIRQLLAAVFNSRLVSPLRRAVSLLRRISNALKVRLIHRLQATTGKTRLVLRYFNRAARSISTFLRFALLKGRIRLRFARKRKFPYDDYPTYM